MKKTIFSLFLALATLTSCMDGDHDEPSFGSSDEIPYGNDALTETNVVSIADLKAKYSNTVFNSSNSYKQITEPTQIKGVVVGNDIGGNIYNEVAIDDGTGAILVCISQGGLYGFLPVGQQILVELNELYIGGYGQQPEIGTPYTNAKGNSYVSRMSRLLWREHFKLLDAGQLQTVKPEVFDQSKMTDDSYLKSHCGKLMTIKGVTLRDADGTATFAPEDQKDAANCVSRNFKEYSSSKIVLRTSTYADFAAATMPTGKVDVTGVFTRYRNVWQILMRTPDDIKASAE